MNAQILGMAVDFYEKAGLDTLPLHPNARVPILPNWQGRTPRDMWEHAPRDSNIGIRAAGPAHAAILDADDKTRAETSSNVSNFLTGLGITTCPVVQTPSGGLHFYLALEGHREGAWSKLSPNVGAGEFRYGRSALVAAPPSMIDSRPYVLIAGDYQRLPRVAIKDLAPILSAAAAPTGELPLYAPLAPEALTLHPSRNAWRLLQGQDVGLYSSRSEHEQALLVSLVNSGLDFQTIRSLFLTHPCGGKFIELYAKNPKNAARWLQLSYENARRWVATHEGEGRRIARAMHAWATSHSWGGRTGAVDRAVYMTHAILAYKSGRIVYAASCRDLAERAGVSHWTATNSTHRLANLNLLHLEVAATLNLAARYSLKTENVESLLRTWTLSRDASVGERPSTQLLEHDVFRTRGLGKTGAQVWQLLVTAKVALQVKEVAARTGRHRTTIYRLLDRMRALGMVTPSEIIGREITFKAVPSVNLDKIARALGVTGIAAKQRAEHKSQRAARRDKFRDSKPKDEETNR